MFVPEKTHKYNHFLIVTSELIKQANMLWYNGWCTENFTLIRCSIYPILHFCEILVLNPDLKSHLVWSYS